MPQFKNMSFFMLWAYSSTSTNSFLSSVASCDERLCLSLPYGIYFLAIRVGKAEVVLQYLLSGGNISSSYKVLLERKRN